MALIEQLDIAAFEAYLAETKNTICGRHPICLFMRALLCATHDTKSLMLQQQQQRYAVAWVSYAQSSACLSKSDSSVSYASAVIAEVGTSTRAEV